MLSSWKLAGAALALALVVSRVAAAQAPASQGSVPIPPGGRHVHDAERQDRFERGREWSDFNARHGAWHADWNTVTGSPHRAYGKGIRLERFAGDAASVDAAIRTFVTAHPGVFGTRPSLETLSAHRAGRVWYVRYRQLVSGVPVMLSDWEFRVGTNGRLFAFGADVERDDPKASVTARILPAVARESAKQGLPFDPSVDRAEGADRLYYLPYPTENGEERRLVYRVVVRTRATPGNWIAYVDAEDGRVLWRFDRVRDNVSGTVAGLVHPVLVSDPPNSRPFPHLRVVVGGTAVFTDSVGHYSGAGPDPSSVTASLTGPFCNVIRDDGGANASFSTSSPNPGTVDVAWVDANSHEAERDGFYHVNVAHDYAKRLEPTFTGLDYAVPTTVNIAATCNAFWDGTGVNFYAAGGGCPNTATIPDVVYHEYGHGVNDYVYLANGSGDGMVNGALHEGMADVNAAFLRDDPRIGVGFGGPGTILRTADNTKHYPENASTDPHATGEIIAGAFWDLRQAIGLATAEHLAHFAKHGIPDDLDDGTAMAEFFTETLVADDDDADFSNGTPHSDEIIAAFNAHGIGTGFSLSITHTPVTDRSTGGSVPVTALFRYTGPIGALAAGSPTLHYSVNQGAFQTASMTPTGPPDEFGGAIPAPDSAIVRYYLTAQDTYAQTASNPRLAPVDLYTFVVGSTLTMFQNDMETAAGWVGTAVGDNALTGRWVRGEPVGTQVSGVQIQPEEDHTPNPGTVCWVTGNGQPGGQPGVADVDNGRTTLLTPVFDAGPSFTRHPLIEYYRWYSNNGGSAPGSDFWVVDISNDGGATWTSVENTNATDNSWHRVVFRIEDYLTPTTTMRLRFIASDEGDGSLVEAGVDDFRLLAFASPLTAVGEAPEATLDLAPASPNPFRLATTLRFTLPVRGTARLRIFDLNGRLVRSSAEELKAGPHTFIWDGRNAAGTALPSGTYFVRLEQGGRQLVRRIARLK
jgi:hypothetical protein